MEAVQNISEFIDSFNLQGHCACNLITSHSRCNTLPPYLSPIYHSHISVNNQIGMQLEAWKASRDRSIEQRGGTLIEVIHSPTVCPTLSLNPCRLSSLYEAFKAGNMHLSNVPHYSGCLSHLGQLTSNQKKKKTECGCQHRTLSGLKRHRLPHFSDSNFLKTWIFFWVSG